MRLLGAQAPHGIAGDDYSFIHRDDVGVNPRIRSMEGCFNADCLGITVLINHKPTPFHTAANACSYLGCVLTNAAAKDYCVRSTQNIQVGTNVLAHPVAEHVHS